MIERKDSKAHLAALDGVRGIAIAMVLGVHLDYMGAVPSHWAFLRVLRGFMWAGWSGVDLFFVLSGFLITGILLDTKDSANRAKVFYARRILRIFPLYYLAIFLAIALFPVLSADQRYRDIYPSKIGWLSYLLYLQNWWMPLYEPSRVMLGHFWSLAVEEQFYLLWPWCVWMFSKRALIRICTATGLLAFIVRYALVQQHPASPVILMNTLTRVDTLLAGGFCALAIRNDQLRRQVRQLAPFIAPIALAGMLWIDFVADEFRSRSYYTQSFGYSLLALGYGCVVFWAYSHNGDGGMLDRFLRARWLRFLGKYSYGIYVYHAPLFVGGYYLLGTQSWFGKRLFASFLFCAAVTGISVGLSVLSYEFFEKRFLNLKKYFEPRYNPLPQAHTLPHKLQT